MKSYPNSFKFPSMWVLLLALTASVPRPVVKPVFTFTVSKDNTACDLCTQIVTAVEEAMKSTTVEQEVAVLVAKACEVLPAPYSSLCSSIVQTYVPQIMQWIEQGMEKIDICTKIGLCQSISTKKPRIPKAVDEKWTCAMCEVIVKEAAELLNSTQIPEEILIAVEKLCTLMPEPYGTQCQTIVTV